MFDLIFSVFAIFLVAVTYCMFYLVMPITIGFFAYKAGWLSICIIVIAFIFGVAMSRAGYSPS